MLLILVITLVLMVFAKCGSHAQSCLALLLRVTALKSVKSMCDTFSTIAAVHEMSAYRRGIVELTADWECRWLKKEIRQVTVSLADIEPKRFDRTVTACTLSRRLSMFWATRVN